MLRLPAVWEIIRVWFGAGAVPTAARAAYCFNAADEIGPVRLSCHLALHGRQGGWASGQGYGHSACWRA